MVECVVIYEQGKFGQHSQTSKEGSESGQKKDSSF